MKRKRLNQRIVASLLALVMVLVLAPVGVLAEDHRLNEYPSLDMNGHSDYVIYKEGWRDGRTELALYNTTTSEPLVLRQGWTLGFQDTSVYQDDEKYYLDTDNDKWVQFESGYSYASNHCEEVYVSSRDVVDTNGNTVLKASKGTLEPPTPTGGPDWSFYSKDNLPPNAKKNVSNGHYYKVYDESENWNDAKEYCEKMGGHLVTINSQDEQNFLETLIEDSSKDCLFIGATIDNGSSKWVTDEDFSYTNWNDGEPNNTHGQETVLMLYSHSPKGKWNDTMPIGEGFGEYDISHFGFICEWDNEKSSSKNEEFTLGRDNNSFLHWVNTDERSGFFRVNDYSITDATLRNRLINMTTSNGELGNLLDKMYGPWGGSCYGASCVIGLCYLNYLSLDSFSGGSTPKCFFELKRPRENNSLLDMIEYFHLTQFLKSHGSKSKNAIQTLFTTNGFKIAPKGVMGSYFNSDFYKLLVNEVEKNKIVLLGYFDEANNDGHAIITTDIKYLENGNIEIQLYDLNDLNSDEYNSNFDKLIITNENGKYTARYECPKTPGIDLIENLAYMYYIPLDSLKSAIPSGSNESQKSVSNNRMSLNLKLNAPFNITFSNGTYYSFDGSRIDGDINIYNITPIATTTGTSDEIIIETDYSESLDYSSFNGNCEISVFDSEDYFSVKGSNLESVAISFVDGILLSGKEDYTFDCATIVDNDDVSVGHYQAETNGHLVIKTDEKGKLIADSDNDIRNSKCTWLTKDGKLSKSVGQESSVRNLKVSFEEKGISFSSNDKDLNDNSISEEPNKNPTDSSEPVSQSDLTDDTDIQSPQTGIVKGTDGKWAMYKDGKVDTSYTGIAKNKYGWWRIEKGYVDFKANGIYKNNYGWWKTTNGKVTFKETGVFKNDYGWWRVENSKVNFKANGIYQNKYGWWKTTNGKVTFKENGVFKNDYGWWKVENSKVDFSFTGIASNKYGKWYIKNGKVDFSKNGKVKYNGATYTIKNGKVQ